MAKSTKASKGQLLLGKKPQVVVPRRGEVVGGCFGKDHWLATLKNLVLTGVRLDQTRVCYTEESVVIGVLWNRLNDMFENGCNIGRDHLARRTNRLIVTIRHQLRNEWEKFGCPSEDDPRQPTPIAKVPIKRNEWKNLKRYWLSPDGKQRSENAKIA